MIRKVTSRSVPSLGILSRGIPNGGVLRRANFRGQLASTVNPRIQGLLGAACLGAAAIMGCSGGDGDSAVVESDGTEMSPGAGTDTDPSLGGVGGSSTQGETPGAPTPEAPVPAETAGGGAGGGSEESPPVEMPEPVEGPTGLPVLGGGAHTPDSVQIVTIATSDEALAEPMDLEFNPLRPNELWIVNHEDNSSVILFDPDSESQTAEWFSGSNSKHFLAKPSSLAFSDDGFMATIHQTSVPTQSSTPATFMGPTLWVTRLEPSHPPNLPGNEFYDGAHGSHMDMLHNSPDGSGIAWETDSRYWVFDGFHESITLYNFNDHHGPGGADHSDGEILRYVEGEVKFVDGVSAHLGLDHDSNLLYIADTGNARVATLDITTGTMGGPSSDRHDGLQINNLMEGATLDTLVTGSEFGLAQPSALELQEDVVFVGDHSTGYVHAFTKTGEQVDWLDTGLGEGTLNGMAFDEAGNLFVASTKDSTIIKVSPLQP